jgi:hypothetical protein
MKKTCRYCHEKFEPSRYHPDQEICSSPVCQRRRRSDYHQNKLSKDPAYRDQCRDSQRKWLEKNQGYMKRYSAAPRSKHHSKRPVLLDELHQLRELLKNNVALTYALWMQRFGLSFRKP